MAAYALRRILIAIAHAISRNRQVVMTDCLIMLDRDVREDLSILSDSIELPECMSLLCQLNKPCA